VFLRLLAASIASAEAAVFCPEIISEGRQMRLFFAILICVVIACLPARAEDGLKGAWLRDDGTRVVVVDCGGALCMKSISIPAGSDEKAGDYLVLHLKPAGENTWKGRGTFVSRNIHFSAELRITGDAMTASGCVASMMCKTTAWTRVR
jgi:uncharacterized protein (DUF2147 family)